MSSVEHKELKVQSGSMFKNIRRHAGAEIRKYKGSPKSSALDAGPVDESTIRDLEQQRQRYEHLINCVQALAKETRQVVSGELSLSNKSSNLILKLKQAGQVLSSDSSTQLDTETVPSFAACGSSLEQHVQIIQQTFLPTIDSLVDRQKAVSKEISEHKQRKIDYEHYVYKIQGLEESVKSKGSSKDFQKLENNKQKLSTAAAAYEASTKQLGRTLSQATQDVAVELGVGLSSLARASAEAVSAEAEHMNRIQEKGPAWLSLEPPQSGSIVPAGNKPKLPGLPIAKGLAKQFGGGKTGARPPPPPPEGMSVDSDLQRRLADAEERNRAGAEAYDKLQAELDKTLEKLQISEHLQARAEKELEDARQEIERLRNSSSGDNVTKEEVVELQQRLRDAEHAEQAYKIRINGLERQLAEAAGQPNKTVSSPKTEYSNWAAANTTKEDSDWNPFGNQAREHLQTASSKQNGKSNDIPNTGNWNPFSEWFSGN